MGLCFALTMEKAGYKVLGADVNQDYVDAINHGTLNSAEAGVNEYLAKSSNFVATIRLAETVNFSNFLYTVVATPSLPNGEYNHTQLDGVVDQLVSLGPAEEKKYLIVCCTTMPEYCDKIQDVLGPLNYEVCYNPEFIAQGTILRDQEI